MAYTNRSITGREYKLMLKPSKFEVRQAGIKEVLDTIKSQIEMLNADESSGGELVRFDKKDDNEEKERRVWYQDTKSFILHKNKFLLRLRKEIDDDKYVTDLKCRNSDRYISASYDLSTKLKEKIKTEYKFEEDIVPKVDDKNSKSPDFSSIFSHSASFDTKKELSTIQDLLLIFPGLSVLNIDAETELDKVNNFEAKEISIKLGKIKFLDKDIGTDNLSLNFWYLPDKEKEVPDIVEFSFNYDAKGKNKSNEPDKKMLEEFPISLVKKINDFYLALQTEEFVDLKTAKTKTEFVYKYNINTTY